MSDDLDFKNTLAEALEQRKLWLDSVLMPKLKDEFRLFQSAYSGLYKLLLKKAIIHEDLYRNDMKMGDVHIPPEGPFPESEKIDHMSIRLSQYDSQLDFLINFYAFSVDSFSMDHIKTIAGLVKYFHWTQLSANSQNINTRILVELLALLKGGNDQMSIGIAADGLQRLDRGTKNILKQLKEISDYHREAWKLEARLRVMDYLKFDPATVITHKEETTRQIKRKFAEAMSDYAFYPELIDEILQEDYSGEGPRLKEGLLNKLAVKEDKPKEIIKNVSFKSTLLEGIHALGTLSLTLEDTHRKLSQNAIQLESEKNSFMDKLKRVIRQMFNRETADTLYDIEYFDPITGGSRSEELNFTQFALDLDRKSRFLSSIANRNSATNSKLENAEEDQLLSVLSKNIEEIQAMHKTLAALDIFFKSEAQREEREKMYGIKPELTGIKNAIVKANQKRHEYISRKEEMDQMKRLGIQTDRPL